VKILDLIRERQAEAFALHEEYLNPQMVRVLRTLGFDRNYVEARGAHLFDEQGNRYLDLLSGFGVFAVGRNHPKVIETLRDVLLAELPNLVQLDVSLLAGILAERLIARCPGRLEKVFFCNSGTEAVESALKLARKATGRSKIIYVDHGFHGLTLGSLSINGDDYFREGFGPLLPGCLRVPFDDIEALERALAGNDVAAFVVEPVVGHGVYIPSDDYLPAAQALCRKHGTLFVADEVQTGLGRTGRFFACEHWGLEPDMIVLAKGLSGGFVPVGAVICRREAFDALYDRIDRAAVHGSTFSKNNLAMAAGIATLEVIDDSGLVENAARTGRAVVAALSPLVGRYEFLHDVRGLGLMLALEFGAPESLKLRAAWKLMEKADEGLFCQLITVPLFERHRILSQVAGRGIHVVKFLPSLVIDDEDVRWITEAVTDVVIDCHRVPGAVWETGRGLAARAVQVKLGRS
jgi:ornithine--oxo-acid transaminase